MISLKDTLIEVLTKDKKATKEQIESLLKSHKQTKESFRDILLKEKVISEDDLIALLSRELLIPHIKLSKYKIEPSVIGLVPEKICRQYQLIPISVIGKTLTVAIVDPLNIFALDDLKVLTGFKIDLVLTSEQDIVLAIDSYYKKGEDLSKLVLEAQSLGEDVEVVKEESSMNLGELIEESSKAPIVKLVDLLIIEALKRRASDIHIEPEEGMVRIRYRIDGILHEVFNIPRSKQNAVTARLKIVSGMDITESRIPQDGRFKVRLEGREIDFRVSCLPINFGQKFVLRALDKGNLSFGLEKLGFSEEPLRLFQEAIKKPFGMILVTGPTGSGKSTTLYSIVTQLNTPQKNIITIEDPVEYQIEGITQVQVKPEIGLDFAQGLRSLLRQSPDVIMIGEIRDGETADIAVKASLTGQLILSTLHTNDAASSITRLIDMGVEPFLIASSLIFACAQRLCRKICTHCKEEESVPKDLIEKLRIKDKITFFRGKGCQYCNNTGYLGRVAILEALIINDKIREMIVKKVDSSQINEYAIKELKMRTLRDDALLKVQQGVISLEEAVEATTEE
ncbi:MAG: GspE/PulE family protein [Candidatus Omnitrophota bacterium]